MRVVDVLIFSKCSAKFFGFFEKVLQTVNSYGRVVRNRELIFLVAIVLFSKLG
jgi:hypothetical protein